MAEAPTVETTAPPVIQQLTYDPDSPLEVPLGVRSMGDAAMMVFSARNVDPFLYCVGVHLHSQSVPNGIIKGMIRLQQMPRIDPNKPVDWVANEIYECPNDRVEGGQCPGILTDDLRQGLYWMCPKCGALSTNDPDKIPEGGMFEQYPVYRVWQKYYAFGASVWGDVLAEYVQRLWKMRKRKGEEGYRVMVLVRRPRKFLQELAKGFIETPTAKSEDALVAGRSTQSAMGVEYVLYGPDAIAKDLETGTSLATRMAVLMRGG